MRWDVPAGGLHGIPDCFRNGGMKARTLSFLLHQFLVMNINENFRIISSDTFKPLDVKVWTTEPSRHSDAKNASAEHLVLLIPIPLVNISEIGSMSQTLEIENSTSFFISENFRIINIAYRLMAIFYFV